MARRKRSKPKREAIETTEGVVTTTTWVGYQLPPEPPPKPKRRHCPKCGWGPATTTAKCNGGDRYGSDEHTYSFECRNCITEDHPTRWKEAK